MRKILRISLSPASCLLAPSVASGVLYTRRAESVACLVCSPAFCFVAPRRLGCCRHALNA